MRFLKEVGQNELFDISSLDIKTLIMSLEELPYERYKTLKYHNAWDKDCYFR